MSSQLRSLHQTLLAATGCCCSRSRETRFFCEAIPRLCQPPSDLSWIAPWATTGLIDRSPVCCFSPASVVHLVTPPSAVNISQRHCSFLPLLHSQSVFGGRFLVSIPGQKSFKFFNLLLLLLLSRRYYYAYSSRRRGGCGASGSGRNF